MTIAEQLTSIINNNATISQNAQKVHDVGEKKGRKIVGSMVDKSITEITASDLEGITNIGAYALYGCKSLTSIEIPSSVTSIDSAAFSGCTALTHITIPSSVIRIGSGAFSDCSNSLTVYTEYQEKPEGWSDDWAPNNNTVWGITGYGKTEDGLCWVSTEDGAEIIRYAGSATELEIPEEIGGVAVRRIGNYAFANCLSLASVIIPNGVTVIGRDAFDRCRNLASISLPDGITIIDTGTFAFCQSLKDITIPSSVTSIGFQSFHACTSLAEVILPDSVTELAYGAFGQCFALTKVVIPLSVASIGERAFYDCSKLTIYTEHAEKPEGWADNWNEDDLPVVWGYRPASDGLAFTSNGDGTCSVSGIGTCSDVDIVVPRKSPSGDLVTGIYASAFGYSSSIVSIVIPDSVTAIGGSAFRDCSKLASVTIPDSVTTIGRDAFGGCTSLTYSTYGNAKYLGNNENPYLFLVEAESIEIVSAVIHEKTKIIGDSAFWRCKSLTSITIPDSVCFIHMAAFHSSGLTSVVIPNSITYLDEYAFYNCDSLTSITIPVFVTNISSCAFGHCDALKVVTVSNTIPPIISYDAFKSTQLTQIIVPYGCGDAYKTATNWSAYADIIVEATE